MKTLQNSLKKLRQMQDMLGGQISGILIENEVADNATSMQRTRLKGVGAWCKSAMMSEPIVGLGQSYEPPLVAVLSVAAHNALNPECDIQDIIDAAVTVIALNVSVTSAVGQTDTAVTTQLARDVASTGGYEIVKEPFEELDSLMCGKNFYVYTYGGTFEARAMITLEYDRVNITQEEWQLLNVGSC